MGNVIQLESEIVSDEDNGDEPDAAAPAVVSDDAAEQVAAEADRSPVAGRRSRPHVPARWAVAGVAAALVGAVGALAAMNWYANAVETARTESVQAAKESTEAMLSYQASTAAAQLKAAEDRMTGSFQDSFRELVHDVVIPGSEKKHISTVATVPAAASVSAGRSHAVVLAFVDQVAVVDNGAPSDTASIVRVTLEKVGGHWLISAFEPI